MTAPGTALITAFAIKSMLNKEGVLFVCVFVWFLKVGTNKSHELKVCR